MNGNNKSKLLILFLFCFIFMNSWCEEDTIIIGGHAFSSDKFRNKEYFVIPYSNFESLDGIEQLEQLREIYIRRNEVLLKDISAIGKLTELTHLDITVYAGGVFRIRDMIGASKLKTLYLSYNGGTIDFEGIENFPELEDIHIFRGTPINGESLAKLQKLKILEFYMPEQNTNLQFLTYIPNLEDLTLNALNLVSGTDTYIDIDAGVFQNMKNLKFIEFAGFHIENFNLLSKIKNLKGIEIPIHITTDEIDRSLFHNRGIGITDYSDH